MKIMNFPLPHRAIVLLISLFIAMPHTGFSQYLEEKPLLNFQLGIKTFGAHISSAQREDISFYNFGILPRVGYFFTKDLEAGLSAKAALQRGSDNSGVEEGNGYALGYYARYGFTGFNPLNLLTESNTVIFYPYLEWEHRVSNMTFLPYRQSISDVTFTDEMNITEFLPKAGVKFGGFKSLFVTLSVAYRFGPDYQYPPQSPIEPYLSLEYHFNGN